jgi:dienelactone hydrolase
LADSNSVETYIAYPQSKSTDKAVLILTDVIGHKFNNAQLIADQFAANGYFVAMPDLFNGDPIPLNRPADFDIMKWLTNGHTFKEVDPICEAVIKDLRSTFGVKKLGGVGYCFGAKYVARFLKKGSLDAGYMAHPSFVDEAELKAIEGPLSIAAAETDEIFPPAKRRQSEDILFKMDVPWQINLYSDTEHGFAVRADLTAPRVKWAKEQAFYQAVQWFDQYLKE